MSLLNTETLQDRLRHGADNIHSIGPDRAAELLKEAGERLARIKAETEVAGNAADMYGRQLDEITALVGADEAGDGERDTSWKAASPVDLVRGFVAGRREFLERAVCHPGPPLSEHEDYDPEADLGELEASVLERMDLELKAERELRDIRKMCEEVLGRTPDPARTTMQVVRDLCADHSAARTYRANMEDPSAGLEPHETTRRMIDEFATYPGRDEEGCLTVLEVLVPKDRTCIESDKVAAIGEPVRFRRVPRDPLDGYEVLLDGVWHSLAEDPWGWLHPKITDAITGRWEDMLTDPEEQRAAEAPDGVDLDVAPLPNPPPSDMGGTL